MNYSQNQKIQIKHSSLIVGIDITKDKLLARAQDDRSLILGSAWS